MKQATLPVLPYPYHLLSRPDWKGTAD